MTNFLNHKKYNRKKEDRYNNNKNASPSERPKELIRAREQRAEE